MTINDSSPSHSPQGAEPEFDGVFLVGSMQGTSIDDVFGRTGDRLGRWLRRIGDGEIGPGRRWVFREYSAYRGVDGLEVVHTAGGLFPVVTLADGADADRISLNGLNYAEKAAESFAVFRQHKAAGVLAPDTRFLVSVPSTLTAMMVMIAPEARSALAPLRDEQLRKDLERLADIVPADELAVCFDAIESPAWRDGKLLMGGAVTRDDLVDGLLRPLSWVPEEAEVGFHLCYGDQNARRDKTVGSVAAEGLDVGSGADGTERLSGGLVAGYLPALAELGNAIFDRARRPVQWLHVPTVHGVEHVSAEAYAPLAELRVPDDTQIYLGLLDLDGGLDATRRHIAAASTALQRFGISTECGLGRVSDEEFEFSIEVLHRLAGDMEGTVAGAHGQSR